MMQNKLPGSERTYFNYMAFFKLISSYYHPFHNFILREMEFWPNFIFPQFNGRKRSTKLTDHGIMPDISFLFSFRTHNRIIFRIAANAQGTFFHFRSQLIAI